MKIIVMPTLIELIYQDYVSATVCTIKKLALTISASQVVRLGTRCHQPQFRCNVDCGRTVATQSGWCAEAVWSFRWGTMLLSGCTQSLAVELNVYRA